MAAVQPQARTWQAMPMEPSRRRSSTTLTARIKTSERATLQPPLAALKQCLLTSAQIGPVQITGAVVEGLPLLVPSMTTTREALVTRLHRLHTANSRAARHRGTLLRQRRRPKEATTLPQASKSQHSRR